MRGDNVQVAFPLFQEGRGGAVPTSPHQLIFETISSKTCNLFVTQHHYKRKAGSSGYHYGMYFNGELQGVIGIGKSASYTATLGVCGIDKAPDVWELNRLVLTDEMPKNSESRFIGWVLRQLPRGMVLISYADTDQGHTGTVYRATNWIYTGLTKPRTDMDLGAKHHRHYDKSTIDRSKRKPRSAKHRFVYFTNPVDRDLLKWQVVDYGVVS